MSVYGGGDTGYGQRGQINFDAIGEAWRLLTPQLGTWILAFLAMFGVNIVVAIGTAVVEAVTNMFAKGLYPLAFVASYLFSFVVGSVLGVGLFRMAIKQTRGEAISVSDLFSPLDWNAVGTYMLGMLIIYLSCLTIIGEFFAAGLLMFAVPLSIEQRLRPTAAIRGSFALLKNDWFMATVFCVVVLIISLMGVLALIIGLFVTMPLLYLAIAVQYRNYVPADFPSQTYPGAYPGVNLAGMTPLYPSPTAPVAPLYTPPVEPTQPIYPPAQAPQPTAPLYPTDAAQPTPVETLYGAGDTVAPPSATLQETHDPSVMAVSDPALSPDAQDAATPPSAETYTHSSDVPAPQVPDPQQMEQLVSEMRSAAEPGVELGVHDVAPQHKPD